MEKRIITISREFGSGGRTIGRMVAEKLGIPFYDKELVDQIAMETGFAPSFVEEHGEHAPSTSRLSYAFSQPGIPGVMNGLTAADFLWSMQCNVILNLAEQGPCVIVGRNADYILKDREDCLRVYVHADEALRAKRVLEVYGERESPVHERIADKDARRRAYYEKYTACKWGDADNYHITLDSLALGLETCVNILESLY